MAARTGRTVVGHHRTAAEETPQLSQSRTARRLHRERRACTAANTRTQPDPKIEEVSTHPSTPSSKSTHTTPSQASCPELTQARSRPSLPDLKQKTAQNAQAQPRRPMPLALFQNSSTRAKQGRWAPSRAGHEQAKKVTARETQKHQMICKIKMAVCIRTGTHRGAAGQQKSHVQIMCGSRAGRSCPVYLPTQAA